MDLESGVVAAAGITPDRANWTLRYRVVRGHHCLEFSVDGDERDAAWGFDIPGTTEIGFSSSLTPGRGRFLLYGLVTSRIRFVRGESREGSDSEVPTSALSPATRDSTCALRTFVMVRPPVDDVTALVGLDQDGEVVQRIDFPCASG